MREWRNRQTRTFEGRVGDRTGSIPVSRTKQITPNQMVGCYLFLWDNESNPSLECLHSRIGCAFLTKQRLPLASNLVGKNSSRQRAFPSFLNTSINHRVNRLGLFCCYVMWNLIRPSNARIRGLGAQIRQKDVPCSHRNSVTNLVHEVNLPVFFYF